MVKRGRRKLKTCDGKFMKIKCPGKKRKGRKRGRKKGRKEKMNKKLLFIVPKRRLLFQ